ncbi:neuronal membrane glycoprotein M6-a-like [Apostichopus japonicus]|uniref:neuronal membrane glycoprotein M6-a-like n=1 Tax=Stichopus japonicus TaxID=307972 RepID=UPI003AB3278D
MGTGPVPVSSLIAVLLICIGIGLFCGTGYVGCQQVYDAFNSTSTGFTATNSSGKKLDNLPKEVKDVTNPVGISICCLSGFMVFIVIFFLFQAFMATAAITREDYSSQKMICGTKGWTIVSVVLSYLLTILWMLIFAGSFYCFLVTYMISSHEGTDYAWSAYGLKGGELKFSSDGQAEAFRDYMKQAYTMFAICFGSSFIVLLGMVNLTMCHSANLAHIKTSSQWQIYNDRKSREMVELNTYQNTGMTTSTSHIPLSTY